MKEGDQFKPVSFSKTTMTELMVPAYANFGGKVHGGTILSLMDKVAYVCSSKHAGTYCVTVSVDAVDFISPVEVGALVSLHASVNYVGRTSLIIGIKAVAEDLMNRTESHTNTSYFTMVAMGEDGKPAQVPGLILENHEDVRRFIKSKIKKEFKRTRREELNKMIDKIGKDDELDFLKGERCQVSNSIESE